MTLLSRDKFREQVFERDGHRCVFCSEDAADAHHIMERRLWPDGGYYLANGASVCPTCHIKCESTLLSPDDVREAAGIQTVVLPPELNPAASYDKWGNTILPSGKRLKGPLYDRLSDAVHGVATFVDWVKYPRTYHLPWSLGATDDDKTLPDTKSFHWKNVVVTEKMDGENTTLYHDHLHARSIDSKSHPSRDWLKSFWSGIKNDIPDHLRICGENLYARHSIAYDSLSSFFMGFSIWDNQTNVCMGWDDTVEWFELLGIEPVPVLYRGVYDREVIQELWDCKSEGYVVRLASEFHYDDFTKSVAKFVRPNHVQTDGHWMHSKITPNKIVDRV